MSVPLFDYLSSTINPDDVYLCTAAAMGIAVLYMLVKNLSESKKISSRIKSLQARRADLKGQLIAPRKRNKKNANSSSTSVDLMRIIVDKLNLLQKSQVGKMNKILANAGYRSKDAIFVYTFCQLLFPFVGLALGLYLFKIDFSQSLFDQEGSIFFTLVMAFIGFKLPQTMVKNARTKRHHLIQRGLSDTLDLMMICAEAGLSLAAALDRVSRELTRTYPEMAEELAFTSIEIGFLPDRKKALSNLADRVDMPEIRGITGVLIQTEKYGTPIAQALRVLSAEFRMQRMMRAEQKAARLPAIMTIPMIVFILPTLFVVVLAPAMLKLKTL